MSFRVTNSLQIDRSLWDIQQANARLESAQNDLSTGTRIHRPSDDPTANARAMVLKTTMAENTQYQSNIQSIQGWASVTDTSTTSYVNAMQRLRTLAVQAANGSLQPQDKAAISNEVTQIREEIRSIGNTQYEGRYIFGGLKTDQQPYPTDVTLSPNDTGKLNQDIAPGMTVPYNVSGVTMFGDTSNGNTNNIFSVIDNFQTLLSQDSSTVDISQQTIAQLDNWIDTAGNARTSNGALLNRLDLGDERLTDVNTSLKKLLTDTADTDIATASLQMNQSQATLEAALAVGAKAMPLSLVDFLK